MNEKLRARLKAVISKYEAIRYVYITEKDTFFIFKESFRDHNEVVGNWEPDDLGYHYYDGMPVTISALRSCAIFHNNRLIQGKKVKTYITRYKDNIEDSHEFSIDSILKANKEEVTSESPRYLTPIKNLLKEIDLLKDGRAGRQPVDPIIIKRNDFLAAYYKKIGSPKRIPMQDIQDALRKELGEWFPENAKMVDTHLLSDDQVRRIIKSRI